MEGLRSSHPRRLCAVTRVGTEQRSVSCAPVARATSTARLFTS